MMKKLQKLKERVIALPLWFWLGFAVIIAASECVRRFYFDGGCLMMDIFGFPCPTCGMTRATLCALMLRFDLAFKYNPAFWTAPLSGIFLVMAFADRKHPKLWITMFFILIAVLLIIWIYVRLVLRTPLPELPK